MKRPRATMSGLVLFLGVLGSLGALGVDLFEEALHFAIYLAAVTALALWLGIGTARAH